MNRKLLIISTITLLIISLLALLVITNLAVLREVSAHVEQHARQAELNAKLDTHLARAAGEAGTFGGLGNEEYLEEALEALELAAIDLDALRALALASPDAAEHAAFLERQETFLRSVEAGVQTIAEAREQGDPDALAAAIEAVFEYEAPAEELRDEMQDYFNAIAQGENFQAALNRVQYGTVGAVSLLVLLVLLLSLLVRQQIIRPINTLATAATAIARGSNESVPVTNRDEIGDLQRALNHMLSQLRELLAERDAALEESLRAKHAAEAASRAKSTFLANMSHELRTPLNAILGYAEILLLGMSGALNAEMQEDVKGIRDNGQHLLSLIAEILDLAKIEAGRVALEKEFVDVPALLQALKHKNSGLLYDKPVTLVVDAAEKLPSLWADSLRLNQILTNLLSNAIKFTDHGTISLRAYRAGGQMVFEVADTGIGMDQTDLPLIFREFEQVGGSPARQAEGTGLGLAIARHLIHMHGGQVQVASERGRGSTFTVSLPLGQADYDAGEV